VWLQSIQNQLIRDLKASWQKTVLLAILFSIGLWFWIPPLVKAVVREAPDVVAAADPSISPTRDEAAAVSSHAQQPTDQPAIVYSWENVGSVLDRDPLVQSAEVAARHTSPFGIDADQFPPPVLFSDEPRRTGIPDSEPAAADTVPSAQLLLKSTIVGENRRAALINRKLYLEGSAIQIGGKTYLLAAVYPRKVLLRSGEDTLELTMAAQPGLQPSRIEPGYHEANH